MDNQQQLIYHQLQHMVKQQQLMVQLLPNMAQLQPNMVKFNMVYHKPQEQQLNMDKQQLLIRQVDGNKFIHQLLEMYH